MSHAVKTADTTAKDAALLAPYDIPVHRAGTGREGRLSVRMVCDESSGRTILAGCRSEPPLSVQGALYCEHDAPRMAYVYISSTAGGMLPGDRHVMNFNAGPRTASHITTQGATRIHGNPRMPHECVMQHVRMTLEDGAYLEYMPDQIIPYAHSALYQDATISVHETATLIYTEIIPQGRAGSGESFEYRLLDSRVRITGHDGDTLRFADASRITPDRTLRPCSMPGLPEDRHDVPPLGIKSFGIMSEYDVIASLYVITEKKHVPELQKRADEIILQGGSKIIGGAVTMRNNTGMLARMLGPDTESLRHIINKVAACARMMILDAPFTEVRKS